MRAVAALGLVGLLATACSVGADDSATRAEGVTQDVATAPAGTGTSGASPIGRGRVTVVCTLKDLLGIVVMPTSRRIEILETKQEFAGYTGLPATGHGMGIAALTRSGLTFGGRCRARRPPLRNVPGGDFIGPWPETVPTWIRCGLYGDVLLDVTAFRGGYRLSVGGPPNIRARATLLPGREGGISFSYRNCSRFVVTGLAPP